MVWSTFWRSRIFLKQIYQNYLVALKYSTGTCTTGYVHLSWHYKGGLKVHRLTMMQWWNLTIWMWFIFQHTHVVSPSVHPLLPSGPSVLQLLDSRGIEALILILKKSPRLQIWLHYRSDTASQTSDFFFHVGKQKIVRWCQIRIIWRVINQFKATVMHSSHWNHILVCTNNVLVKQDSLPSVFQAVSEMSLVLLFKVLNYLSSVGLSGRKQCS